MPVEVQLREFNPDSEALQSNYNAGKFLHGIILHAPMSRRDPAQYIGSKNDPKEDGERWFREVKVISQEEREEGV
jgi:hypothetical protein